VASLGELWCPLGPAGSVRGAVVRGDSGFVGRESELRSLSELVATAGSSNPHLAYVTGDPGAGKSMLLARFVTALSTDTLVVRGSGDESEMLLPYGVISQLDPAMTPEAGTDPLAVGADLLDLLGRWQAGGRVVVMVLDDLHWADRLSLRAILFAVRRLRADRVLAVVSARTAELPDPGWARFVAGDARVTQLRLGGFSPADVVALAAALGVGTLSTRGAARLVEHTGGNPLYCRSLLDELGTAELDRGRERLPAPRALAEVIVARVAALPTAAQAFLAAAAVLGRRSRTATVAEIAGLVDAEDALDAAVAAGLLLEGSDSNQPGLAQVGFAHPLYRAAVYADLSPGRRRRLHARAAEVVDGDAGLVHRVAAAQAHDGGLAVELEQIGRVAAGRGDTARAAWAWEQSAALSARPDDRDRRLLDAVEILLDTADTTTAARILAETRNPSARRDALLGLVDVYTAVPTAEARLRAAWAGHDPVVEPEVGARAAVSLTVWLLISGRSREALEWADRAVDASPARSVVRAQARTAQALALASAGRSVEGLDRLAFLPAAGPEVPLGATDALVMRGMLKVFTDDLAGAVGDLSVGSARLRAGVACSYPGQCLTYLGEAHYRRGDWDTAVVHAELAISLAQDTDRAGDLALGHGFAALVPAARGQWDLAQAHVGAAHAAAEAFPLVFALAAAALAGAATAFARGDPAGVLSATEQVRATGRLTLGGAPGVANWRGFEADALIGLGRTADAEAALDGFEAAIPNTGMASASLAVARCRGNLSAARGDGAAAAVFFAEAHRLAPQVPMPFEQALLGLDDGRRLRRGGDRQGALAQLGAAHQVFTALGATPYVAACVEEFTAAGVRATTSAPVAALGLSPAELAVARLAADGRTNREVAGQLYLSVKTVEYHLRNTYIKLDITSRRALPALLH
jgi:DNA-binding CsgD family transcriptional regulator